MNVEIINIGDELLIGQVVNTNASFMAEELNRAGFNVIRISTIADNSEDIELCVKEGLEHSDCVLITGGLGPTKDDITKFTLAKIFDSPMVENKDVLANVKRIFSYRGFELTPTNRLQAQVPQKSKVIENLVGTAPGMCFETKGKLVISMPGVPFEMKEMMTKHVIPMLLSYYKPSAIFHKTILTQGIGESFLSDILEDFEQNLPKHIRLAYLPQANLLRLRLSAQGENHIQVKQELQTQVSKLIPLIGNYFIGFDENDLSLVVAKLLKQKGKTLSTAESCTGGNISHAITLNAGASNYFKGSIVAYSNQVKEDILGVDKQTLETFGAVSKEVAQKMAIGGVNKLKTDYCISTTGIAGPTGGSDQKPIGTIWIGIANKEGKVLAKEFNFFSSRENFINRATNQAFAMLLKWLKD